MTVVGGGGSSVCYNNHSTVILDPLKRDVSAPILSLHLESEQQHRQTNTHNDKHDGFDTDATLYMALRERRRNNNNNKIIYNIKI